MDDRVIQFRLGVFVAVLLTVLMTVLLVFLFGELPSRDQKLLYVRFQTAPGVSIETPVRKDGILIGRVRKVTPIREKEGGVVLAITISPQSNVYDNDICKIGSDNLFGDAVLQFVRGEGNPNRELENGEYINGVVASNPLDALRVVVDLEKDLNKALASIRTAGEEVGNVAESLNVLVVNNQDQFNRILGKTERALGRFETAMTSINQVVSNESLQLALEEALEGVPLIVNEAGQLLQGLRRVSDEAEKNLANIRGFTEPLKDQGDKIVGKLSSSAGRLDELLAQLNTFGNALNSREGSVGQFVHNPELYQNLNQAAKNIEDLSRRLEPIVNDARVAVDKVARNPRMLGVQGALDRRSSGIK